MSTPKRESDQVVSPVTPLPETYHAQGIHSTIFRRRLVSSASSQSAWMAIKRVSDHPPWKFQPHNAQKEIRILKSCKHVNVIEMLVARRELEKFELYYEIHMPFVPLTLSNLLDSVLLLPTASRALIRPLGVSIEFDSTQVLRLLTKSIAYQILLALGYLYNGILPGERGKVAHRDIKPANVLIDGSGCVKLIDFGIAWSPDFARSEQAGTVDDGWEEEYVEPEDKMCCAVASGPHRAPELLFSPRIYNAFATDMWSFGTVLAQFFTPLRYVTREYGFDDEIDEGVNSDEEEAVADDILSPVMVPKSVKREMDAGASRLDEAWERDPLFDASRGEIGLAWSIFKVRGTPDEALWPTFKSLPDGRSASFRATPRIDLGSRLPNLPTQNTASGDTFSNHVLELLEGLLTYEPEDRISARDALHCKWFMDSADGTPLLLPPTHPAVQGRAVSFEGRTLVEYIKPWVDAMIQKYERDDKRATSEGDDDEIGYGPVDFELDV
ncbi:hypothetical protein FRB93_007355 [Tulasnella sp. JGI-2019a]|nr:hypothetical protein FRB93_007355 [Tulasnella sp. JGI-2019a]